MSGENRCAPQPLKEQRQQALLALKHCGVLRTCFDHEGLLSLYEDGQVRLTTVEGDDDALDWRLA